MEGINAFQKSDNVKEDNDIKKQNKTFSGVYG